MYRLVCPLSFDLAWILQVGGSLLVPSPLPGPPVVKVTHAGGYCGTWPGQVVSVRVPPKNCIAVPFAFFHLRRLVSPSLNQASAPPERHIPQQHCLKWPLPAPALAFYLVLFFLMAL